MRLPRILLASLLVSSGLVAAGPATAAPVVKGSCAKTGSYVMSRKGQLMQCRKKATQKTRRWVIVRDGRDIPFPRDPFTRTMKFGLLDAATRPALGLLASGANALDIITGGYPDSSFVCDGKDYSLTAYVIQNSSSSNVNLQVYINSVLTRQAQAYSASNNFIANGQNPSGACGWGSGQSQTASGTLSAGEIGVVYVAAGGEEQNLIGGSHYLQFGIPGSDVYQFDLDLNAGGGFTNWEVLSGHQTTGPNTGGLTLNPCVQSGSSVSVNTGYVISNGWNPNGTSEYGQNTPICFNYTG